MLLTKKKRYTIFSLAKNEQVSPDFISCLRLQTIIKFCILKSIAYQSLIITFHCNKASLLQTYSSKNITFTKSTDIEYIFFILKLLHHELCKAFPQIIICIQITYRLANLKTIFPL